MFFRALRAGRRVLLWSSVAVCAAASVYAQQPGETASLFQGPLTLEQVLQLAESQSEPIAAARAGIVRADAEGVRARSGLRPQLSASASYERLLASEFSGIFDTTSSTPACAPFSLNPDGSIDARVSEIERAIDCGAVGSSFFGTGTSEDGLADLPFGRSNTWRASLSASQNLWSGGRNGAQIKLATASRESADLNLTTTRGQLSLDAATAFYDVALSARLVAIAEATLEQAEATLRQVQAGFDAGTQPEFEVLRARVNRDNQRPVLIRQRLNQETAALRLRQLLDVPPTFELEMADVFADEALPPPAIFAPRVAAIEQVISTSDPKVAIAQGLSAPLPSRAAVDLVSADVHRAEAALDLAKAQRKPSASLTSDYSRVSYPGSVALPVENFRNNWSIGANIQIPLMTGGRLQAEEAIARADVTESRARLQQAQELSGLDTRLAWAELLAARTTWEASASTVQEATRAYEIADVRYRAGVSTQLELSDARLQLQQAQATRAVAARDVQVARARVALLPDLPLSLGTGAAGTNTAVRAPATNATSATPAQPQTGASTFQSGQGTQRQVGR